jgi:hypothetical protein
MMKIIIATVLLIFLLSNCGDRKPNSVSMESTELIDIREAALQRREQASQRREQALQRLRNHVATYNNPDTSVSSFKKEH